MPLPKPTIEGRLAADPELRFVPSGKAVCNIRMVASQKKKDAEGNWVDDKVLWIDGTAWEQLAENIAESTRKGDDVIVTGRLETHEWTTDGGEKRQKIQVLIDKFGVDLRFRRVPHGAGRTERSSTRTEPASDPWASGPSAQYDEPPF